MENILMAINFFGGLALFIFGITLMSDGLQKSAGESMKSLLKVLTSNRYLAVIVGAAVTMVIQSSSATTVMVVGFVNAGIINLSQSVGVIMGANIGTTVTAWIASAGDWMKFLKPTTIAPGIVAIGVVLTFVSKSKRTKTIGEVLIGFGILFIGMSEMSSAVKPLRDSEAFKNMFEVFGTNPFLGILAGTFVTVMVQSSSASMGILLSLVSVGLVPTSAAIYIILGQNIGTCVTALLSSIGASKNGKAAAYIHLLFNLIGSTIFAIGAVIIFSIPANEALASGNITETQVSIFHTVFNITNTILLFPFANLLVKIAKKLAGIKDEDEVVSDANEIHLDDRALVTPSFAVSTVFDEICQMYENTLNNYSIAVKSVLNNDSSNFEQIAENERIINRQAEVISQYMVKVMKLDLSSKENEQVAMYFHTVTDIERIGDHVENLSEYCNIMTEKNIKFSEKAVTEITNIFEVTKNAIIYSFEAFKDENIDSAIRTVKIEEEIDILEKQLRANHMKRLSKGVCSTDTGVVFLDILQNLERISDHTNNIAGYIIKE